MSSVKDVWTIKKVIDWSDGFLVRKGVESPRVDVELLLSKVTGLKRIDLYIQFDRVLSKSDLASFKQLLLRRARREPTAYILGCREFYGINFTVDNRVLIPRPETEHLVDKVIEVYKEVAPVSILEIGTGCGNIAVAIAANLPNSNITSVDTSKAALEVAAENVNRAELQDRISLLHGDLFSSLGDELQGSFDAVVSNPPYVEESYRAEMQSEVLNYEPHLALFAGSKGLDTYKKLIPNSVRWLKPNGLIVLEIGIKQASPVSTMLTEAGFSSIEVIPDYSGIDRIVFARKNHG